MKKISVAIATYEMHGEGVFFIKRCIDSIIVQDYSNVEIVVADHSVDNQIEEVCKNYNVKYIRNSNKRGSSSANFNCAIDNCSGDYIKILCQDDVLYTKESLSNIVNKIEEENNKWLVSSYYHTHDLSTPTSLHHPHKGSFEPVNNLIGTHSCLTISKEVDIRFDENLIWFMDCEYYSRLYNKYSLPSYLFIPTMVQSIWKGQVTSTIITPSIVKYETDYIIQKTKCL